MMKFLKDTEYWWILFLVIVIPLGIAFLVWSAVSLVALVVTMLIALKWKVIFLLLPFLVAAVIYALSRK